MKNFYEIMYIPTGLVYSLDKAECDRLTREEPENFKVIDADYKNTTIEEPIEDKTVYDKVIEEKPEEQPAKKVVKARKK